MTDCYRCAPQRKDIPMDQWDTASLRGMVNGLFSCCAKHKTEFQKELEKRDGEGPKKYVLKQEAAPFIPKTTVKNPPNYQDREPNDGSLIE